MLTRVLILLLVVSAIAAFLLYGPEGMVGGWMAMVMSTVKTVFYLALELGQTILSWLMLSVRRLAGG